MHVMAAVVGVTHTLKVVTQTEWAAIVGLGNRCPGGICCLFHVLPQVEPLSEL